MAIVVTANKQTNMHMCNDLQRWLTQLSSAKPYLSSKLRLLRFQVPFAHVLREDGQVVVRGRHRTIPCNSVQNRVAADNKTSVEYVLKTAP